MLPRSQQIPVAAEKSLPLTMTISHSAEPEYSSRNSPQPPGPQENEYNKYVSLCCRPLNCSSESECEMFFFRSQSERRSVALCEPQHEESTDHSDCGQGAILHNWTVGTTGIKGELLFWRLVGSHNVSAVLRYLNYFSFLRILQKKKVFKGSSEGLYGETKGCILCHFLSGCPTMECQDRTPAFQGCMRLIFINSQPTNLNHVQQGLLGNYNELQFDTCNIRDR